MSNATRRLLLTLAHVHGTLLALVHLAFASTLTLRAPRVLPRAPLASACLVGAGIALPLGFLLGGLWPWAATRGSASCSCRSARRSCWSESSSSRSGSRRMPERSYAAALALGLCTVAVFAPALRLDVVLLGLPAALVTTVRRPAANVVPARA
mgnify:CR=1 FL=1